jgi:ribonuclease BN (tRNA processing enzyme)
MFELMMNGVGDAFSRIHWGTSFLLRREGFVLAVDCPDSYRRALLDNAFPKADGEPIDVGDIDAMWLTHLHGDHVNGLEMAACFKRFAFGAPLTLYTSPEAARDLWPRRLQASLGVLYDGTDWVEQRREDFLDVHVVGWGEPVEIGPFTVTTRPTVHHLAATAMRITDGESTLAYSCDTAFDPELIAWLAPGADLILHETSMGPAHTPIEELAGLDAELRERMLVAHYPDAFAGSQIDGLTLAEQGAIYTVGG